MYAKGTAISERKGRSGIIARPVRLIRKNRVLCLHAWIRERRNWNVSKTRNFKDTDMRNDHACFKNLNA